MVALNLQTSISDCTPSVWRWEGAVLIVLLSLKTSSRPLGITACETAQPDEARASEQGYLQVAARKTQRARCRAVEALAPPKQHMAITALRLAMPTATGPMYLEQAALIAL